MKSFKFFICLSVLAGCGANGPVVDSKPSAGVTFGRQSSIAVALTFSTESETAKQAHKSTLLALIETETKAGKVKNSFSQNFESHVGSLFCYETNSTAEARDLLLKIESLKLKNPQPQVLDTQPSCQLALSRFNSSKDAQKSL